MPLDPDVRAVLDSAVAVGMQPPFLLGAVKMREQMRKLRPPVIAPFAEERTNDFTLPCAHGDIRARLYRPSQERGTQRLPVLVYYHGGGWVLFDLDSYDAVCRRISVRSGCAILSVEYHLAPEWPFPAALNDAWDALLWVREEGAAIGIDRDRVAVSGDSAGGNLAAVVALRARDAGIDLRLQQLIYPVLDCDLDRASYARYETAFGLDRPSMAWYWDQYVPDSAKRCLPETSPLRASNMRGLAPAHIVVMEYDILHDEGVEYAERLRSAGVPVILSDYAGLNHGVLHRLGLVQRADAVITELSEELRRAVA